MHNLAVADGEACVEAAWGDRAHMARKTLHKMNELKEKSKKAKKYKNEDFEDDLNPMKFSRIT